MFRSIATTGFPYPEGIAYQADDYFLIAEEGLANVVRIRLPRTGNGPVARSTGAAFNLAPNQANAGIEGVGYCTAKYTATGTLYVVGEPLELHVFRKSGTRVRNAGSDNGGLAMGRWRRAITGPICIERVPRPASPSIAFPPVPSTAPWRSFRYKGL